MSSKVKPKKGSIVLFQHGFLGNHESLSETIRLMEQKNPSRNIGYFEGYINMDAFVESGYKGVAGFYSNTSFQKYLDEMEKIINFIKNNPYKNILIRTKLSGDDLIDSVSMQRSKLEHIVQHLYTKVSDRSIILIGHSQGGIVNMEVALSMPKYVKSIISINTPYNENLIASALEPLIMEVVKKVRKFEFGDTSIKFDDDKKIERLEKAIGTLTSGMYFHFLKQKWENATEKPSAVGIAGLSGVLTDKLSTNDSTFDGLVTVSELNNIKLNHLEYFFHEEPVCPENEVLWDKHYSNRCTFCLKDCPLPKMSFDGEVLNAITNYLKSTITGLPFNPMDLEIITAIQCGLMKKPYGGRMIKIYLIYLSIYSHQNIITNKKVINYLLGLLN